MDRRRLFGLLLVVISAFGFGSGSLFAQPVYASGVDWVVLSSWRFLFGAAFAWGWLILVSRGRLGRLRLERRAVIAAIALGVLFVGNSGTYFAGLQTVSPSLAALLVYIYPALVAVLSLRVGRRLQGARAWSALALALVGVVLAVGGIDARDAPPPIGLALVLASPVIYAVWIVLAARLSGERKDSVGHASDDGAAAGLATALMMSATAAVYWLGSLGTGRPVLPAQIPAQAWFGLAGVGIVSTFIAIQAFYAGARRLGAAEAALVSTVEPIWTIVLAALLFGDRLEPTQLVGGALILTGVVIAQAPGIAIARPRIRLADE